MSNGVKLSAKVAEVAPKTAAINPMTVSDVTIDKNLIRRLHDITFKVTLPANTVTTAGVLLFIDFDGYYSDNFERGSQRVGEMTRTAKPGVNFVETLEFVSKRRLKMTLKEDADNTAELEYIVVLKDFETPNYVPISVKSDVKVRVFISSADETTVTHVSSDYDAPPL